jgi:hypothetical protein
MPWQGFGETIAALRHLSFSIVPSSFRTFTLVTPTTSTQVLVLSDPSPSTGCGAWHPAVLFCLPTDVATAAVPL